MLIYLRVCIYVVLLYFLYLFLHMCACDMNTVILCVCVNVCTSMRKYMLAVCVHK